jgi:hypothetical protein
MHLSKKFRASVAVSHVLEQRAIRRIQADLVITVIWPPAPRPYSAVGGRLDAEFLYVLRL